MSVSAERTVRGAAKKTVSPKGAVKDAAATPEPVKTPFTKAALVAHVASRAGVETKTAKAVLAALEETILGSVHGNGAGEFTLHGLVKITVQQVPEKKKRFARDPFTGEERWFPAKPATQRVKLRALKKLRDAAAC